MSAAEVASGARNLVKRLLIAMAAFVGLGGLVWATITDPKIRAGTWLILALFALKSVLRRKEVLHADKGSDAD